MKRIDKLQNLSKNELLEMLDVLEEEKRRKLEAREGYRPNKGQLPVHLSSATLRAVSAGNGGGKTALGTNEALWACNGYNPVTKVHTKVPARVIVVLDRPEKVNDVWLPELRKWYNLKPEQCQKRGKTHVSAIVFDNGSELLFMFHEQEPMAFESLEVDFAIFDEPPPRHVYIALRRGGRKKGTKPRYLIIGTPLSAPWLRKDIFEPWSRGEMPDTECFKYGTKANEDNLVEGYIQSFGSALTEKEKRIRFDGEFFDLEGLALAHLFKRETHLIPKPKWPAHWPVLVVIDPHPSKNHIAILMGVTPDNGIRVLKELSSPKAARKFAPELKAMYAGYRVVDIICDSLGSGDSTGGDGRLSFIAVLREEGIAVRATTFNEKQDEAWVEMIRDVLLVPLEPNKYGERAPRLQYVEDCKGCIADTETVEWAKIKNVDDHKPKLDIARKDYLACIKYGLATQPRFDKGRERVIRSSNPAGINRSEKMRRLLSR